MSIPAKFAFGGEKLDIREQADEPNFGLPKYLSGFDFK